MSKQQRTVVKNELIVIRIPSGVKRVANEMATEAEFSLSGWIDHLIRKEAAIQGKSVKTRRDIPKLKSMEARAGL